MLAFFVFVGGPIAEELFGLRGFALPRLLNRYTPLVSSIMVGFYFGAWHLIEFFRPGSSQYAIGLAFYPLFILSEIAHSMESHDENKNWAVVQPDVVEHVSLQLTYIFPCICAKPYAAAHCKRG